MKKIFLFLLCLVFLTPFALLHAQAVTSYYYLPQICEQAQAGWHKSYEAHGRTIVVNIPINVPEAENVSALKVSPVPPTDLVPVMDNKSLWGHIEDDVETINIFRVFEWFSPTNKLMNEINPTPKNISIYSNILSINDIKWDETYAIHNLATVREADALLRRVWAQYFPDIPLDIIPFRVEAGIGARPFDVDTMEYYGEEWEDFVGSLMVNFNQMIREIPLIGMMEVSFEGGSLLNSKTIYRGWGPFCRAYLGGNALGLKHIKEQEQALFMAVKEDSVIAENLPLCHLDQIITTYEKLIDQGKLRRVDNLRLGYVGWYNKNEQDTLTLLPIWVAEGVLLKDAKKEPYSQDTSIRDTEFAYIMVNAQTGELIDPWDDNPNRVYEVPEIIRWK